jgi:hypothetical protein
MGLDELADRISERKRVLDIMDGRARDGVEGAIRRIEENVKMKVLCKASIKRCKGR